MSNSIRLQDQPQDPQDERPLTRWASPSRLYHVFVVGASIGVAIALIIGGTTLIRASAANTPRPPAATAPAVETMALKRLDAHEIRRVYAARIEPKNQALLSFETGGTLIEVSVEEGQRVAAGDEIARLDTRLLQAKRAQLSASRRALDSDVELAALELERQRKLKAGGFAANEALDEARLGAMRLSAKIDEADAGLALVDVELDKAALRAPFDAIVGERRLDPGAQVAASSPVLHLLQTTSPRLRVGLPPERAAALDEDRVYTFVAGTREILARLITRRADIDTRTRTVSTLFEPIADEAEGLFFGELLQMAITEQVPGEVYDVPLAALAEDEQGLWSVMMIVASHSADGSDQRHARLQRVAVKVVHLSGEHAYVSGMLDDGMRIVADGRHRVVDGERVRIARTAPSLVAGGEV